MKRSAIFRSVAGQLAVLLLCLGSGCVRSIQPILKDSQVTTDDRLLGNWVTSDGKKSGVVTSADDHKGYKVVYTDQDGKEAPLTVQLGKIGDMTVAECTVDPAPLHDLSDIYTLHLLPLYSFAVVEEMAPRLVLNSMDSDWLKKYIDAHPSELAIISPPGNDSLLVISATTDDFQKFLLRHAKDDGFFGSDTTFVRPGDPTTRPSATPTTTP